MMEAQERSFQENMAQLKEKMEKERQDILREQERMLEHKLKVSLDEACQRLSKKNTENLSTDVIPVVISRKVQNVTV